MIETAKPLFNKFKDMAILNSGFVLYLCDASGLFLLQEGKMIRRNTDGLIWNESIIGTCVHSLCTQLKKPIQLLGPEHYCEELSDIIGTAAPILDEDGELIAVLILGQRMIERPWLDSYQNLTHTQAITSLAAAVEGDKA